MRNIAIFASGSGSNAENIARYFASSNLVKVAAVLSDNPNAGVHKRVNDLGIPSFTFSKEEFADATPVISKLAGYGVSFIVLAGFMDKIPETLIDAFPASIINIHPALLPKFGGQGMYGMHVHRTVIEAGEAESGITIHYINKEYDKGPIIFQASCRVSYADTPETLAARIHVLEHVHYPRIIEELLRPLTD
ncbi:MAG: phosphoribosylglycinamide formyltransferase [Tannerellaceae bacterium]|jgi:phosphoribosylglycinamide formyltransferase-1|nr:phosphoribosylglycinamide formyltransferase [Tannerellaceae bacterium]